MVQMIPHADGIVRDVPKAPEFNEYPKMMTHPGYHPGSIGEEVKSPAGYTHYVGGTSVRFAPVLVHGADDEEYHAAQGYVSQGKSDAAAFARLAAVAVPKSQTYDPVEYPKWAGGVLVNNRDEEIAALAGRREQLGIEPQLAAQPETNPYLPPPDLSAHHRLDQIEAQMADMRQMMGELIRLQTPPPKAVKPAPVAPPATSVSRQQKAADTRKRTAAIKAAAEAAA